MLIFFPLLACIQSYISLITKKQKRINPPNLFIYQLYLQKNKCIFIYQIFRKQNKMRHRQFYQLQYIQSLIPGLWITVDPKFILKQGITFEQLQELNDDIEFYDIKDKDNKEQVKGLKAQYKDILNKISLIFQKAKYRAKQYNNYNKTQTQQYTDQQYYPQQQYQQTQYYPDKNQRYLYPQQTYYSQQNIYQYPSQYSYPGYQNIPQQQYQSQYQQQYQSQYQKQYQPQYQQYYYQQGYVQPDYPQTGSRQYNRYKKPYQPNYYQKQQNQGQTNVKVEQQSTQQQYQQQKQQIKQESIGKNKQIKVEQIKQPIVPTETKTKEVQPIKLEKKKLSIQEIRNLFINTTNQEQLKRNASQELVRQVYQVNNWKKTVQNVKVQHQDKNKQKQHQKGRVDGHKQQVRDFNRGAKYTKTQTPLNVAPNFDIQIGRNQNLQTRKVKIQLQSKAADKDFAELKAKQQQKLGKIQKAKRQINYNLNRVAPENVKDIFQQIQKYATEQSDLCQTLVASIVQKAWQQPKYAASYAKLSSYFAKIDPKKFLYLDDKKEKKNPFKYYLIEKVQHSFDKKDKNEYKIKQQDKQKLAKDLKNHLMGNVKFISELIKIKLIPKKTIRYCIYQLLSNFLEGYYQYFKNNLTEQNFYEFNFEAIIQFLQNLAQKYQQIDEKSKQKGEKAQKQEQPTAPITFIPFQKIAQKLKQYCQLKRPYTELDGINYLKADDYFKLFRVINQYALPKLKDGRRISALLQNLQQRRYNNWKKHNVQSEGPKKLKDLQKQQEDLTPEQKLKVDLDFLQNKMIKLLKKWVQNDNKVALEELDTLAKKFSLNDLFAAYLKYVADDKKQGIFKRIQLWGIIIDKYVGKKSIKEAWRNAIKSLVFLVDQFPYCAATLAKLILQYLQKKGGKISDFFIKFDQEQQEDEYFFMDQVFQKIYHYSKDAQAKSFIEPKYKLSHLI